MGSGDAEGKPGCVRTLVGGMKGVVGRHRQRRVCGVLGTSEVTGTASAGVDEWVERLNADNALGRKEGRG